MLFDKAKFLWFLSAYVPLFIFLGLNEVILIFVECPLLLYQRCLFAFLWSLLAIFSYLGFKGIVGAMKRSSLGYKYAEKAGYRDQELASYALGYGTIFAKISGAGLAVFWSWFFFLFYGLLYARTGLLQLNPTALLLGYRVFNIETKSGEGLIVISKSRIRPGDCFEAYPVTDGIVLADKPSHQ